MTFYDSEAGGALKAAVDDILLEWPGVTERTMFGCPSYQADGTLFAVLVTGGVALTRLPEDKRGALAAQFETGPFQAGSRTVTAWIQVAITDPAALDPLLPYLESSYEAARSESSR